MPWSSGSAAAASGTAGAAPGVSQLAIDKLTANDVQIARLTIQELIIQRSSSLAGGGGNGTPGSQQPPSGGAGSLINQGVSTGNAWGKTGTTPGIGVGAAAASPTAGTGGGATATGVPAGTTGSGIDINKLMANANAIPALAEQCERWVEQISQSTVHYASATARAQAPDFVKTGDQSQIPIGAAVVIKPGNGGPGSVPAAGHVGVKIGNDLMVSDTNLGNQTTSISSWANQWGGGIAGYSSLHPGAGVLATGTPAAATSGPPSAASQGAAAKYASLYKQAGTATGVDPNILMALGLTENTSQNPSSWNGVAGGLMQLTPSTAASLGVKNINDPASNIMGGSKYLASDLARYGGDPLKAVAAYNAGTTSVDQSIKAYGNQWLSHINEFTKVQGETQSEVSRFQQFLQQLTGGMQPGQTVQGQAQQVQVKLVWPDTSMAGQGHTATVQTGAFKGVQVGPKVA
jgi:hypothetical protein